MYDPLLNNSDDNQWAPPVPPAPPAPPARERTSRATHGQERSAIDRRAMLEQLKAERNGKAQSERTEPAITQRSTTRSKKPSRPARAAKILVFGLSTTAMFGAVSGYALAELQQNKDTVPPQPVITPTTAALLDSASTQSLAPQQVLPNTPVADANAVTPKKKTAQATPAQSEPTPVTAAPAATPQVAPVDNGNVVVDIPVPQSAQPGQGQTSGGNQQSSGSH